MSGKSVAVVGVSKLLLKITKARGGGGKYI